MKVYQDWENFVTTKNDNIVVALGNFDGVHLGHQHLIGNMVSKAREIGGKAVVFTFCPHPLTVLKPQCAPPMLLSEKAKEDMISALGVDYLIKARFTRELSQMSPETFVKKVLCASLHVSWAFVGYNYTFGYKGEGTPELLEDLSEKYGFKVHITPSVVVEGEPVSSTLIRHFIMDGDVTRARRFLGYYPWVEGNVVVGERRGRKLGFPTANLEIDPKIVVPASGVYSVKVKYDNDVFPGVANVGVKPTFHGEGNKRNIEVHLLDFYGDLYGKGIKVFFTRRLREEKRFSSVAELVHQIEKDIILARAQLND